MQNQQTLSPVQRLRKKTEEFSKGPAGWILDQTAYLVGGSIARVASTSLQTEHGIFEMHVFRKQGLFAGKDRHLEHVALVRGDLGNGENVLTRMHSCCLTGDIFGSCHCECGNQLKAALGAIAEEGGVLLYLDQEGRGIGLANKIRAYELQAKGLDTLDANLALGLPADARDHSVAGKMLKSLGVKSVKLMTNNPDKIRGLENAGIEVTRVSLITVSHPRQEAYLLSKGGRMGHLVMPNADGRPMDIPI